MKKSILLILLCGSLCILSSCGKTEREIVEDIVNTETVAEIITQHSALGPCTILEAYDDAVHTKLIDLEADRINNFMSFDYYWWDAESWASYSLLYVFSGYPDDESPLFLTRIEFCSTDFNVFGITIGSTLLDAERIMEENGFERTDANAASFEKADMEIKIGFDHEDMTVDKIEIHVHTEYLGNRIY